MKRPGYLSTLILLSLTLTALCWGQTPQLEEQLIIYSRPSQIGTIANRTFRDSNGRVYKEIFYALKNDARAPYTQEMLKEQSTSIYTYDEQGQRIRTEQYDAGMHLKDVWRVAHYGSNERRETKYTAEGVRQYEIRYLENRSVSHLYYDRSGKNLVSIRGLIPNDADLPFGWGEAAGGLACGIVLTPANSLVDELPGDMLYVNIRNVGSTEISISELPRVEIELRDSAGNIIREGAGDPAQKKHFQSQQLFDGQLINPGESGFIYPAYELNLLYGNLPPDSYSIRARVSIGNKNQILISNTVSFEVGGQKN